MRDLLATKTRFSWLGLRLGLSVLTVSVFSLAKAAEPETPPPVSQPHQHSVDLREKITIRMGDTLSLKGTGFSVKLVGFREPQCAVPGQNCGVAFNPEPVPEFQLREGTIVCESAKADPSCTSQLAYTAVADRVTDRAAVRVQIQRKTSKQRLEEKHRLQKKHSPK